MSVADKREAHIAPKVRAKDDGALTNTDYERVAIRVGAGMDFHEAWTAIGKKHDGGNQRKYRNLLLRQPEFKKRVAMIQQEKTEADAGELAGDPFAEAKHMVNMLYRETMAIGDVARMSKAVEMRLDIARQEAARRGSAPAPAPSAAEPADDAEPRPVGKPVTENPQNTTSMDEIKKRMMEKGVKPPTPQVATQ